MSANRYQEIFPNRKGSKQISSSECKCTDVI